MNQQPGDSWQLQRIGLDLCQVSLDDLAEALGETVESLQKYREGERQMPSVIKHRLAEFLRQHAGTMRRLALELDRSA